MIICLLSVLLNIGRLLKFACFLTVFAIVQDTLFLAVHAAPVIKIVPSLLNNTFTVDSAYNLTNRTQNLTPECVAEEIDVTKPYFSLPYRIFAGALVVPITFCSITGNILVIYVIKHYHSLRITGNVFLASLAVADVGVSTLAMTFYGLQLLQGRWILGAFMCRLWFSCDVLFSTASIMHLACIALDRYLSIVRPFEHERTSSERRRYAMIAGCWFGSALLSFIPVFTGIYTTREQRQRISCLNRVRGRCLFAVNQAYAIVSSSFSFWVPSAVMIIMYVMLIRIADRKESEAHRMMDAMARRRASQPNQYFIRRRSSDDQIISENTSIPHPSQRTHQIASKTSSANGHHKNHHRRSTKHDSFDTQMERHPSVDIPGSIFDPRNSQMKHLRRERRAVKTLGAIMIAFLICWLPFFVRYSACEPNRCTWKYMPILEDIVFWVGYFNSMINPFLYAFHNKDFLRAFQKTLSPYIICCRERRTSTSSNMPFPPATPNGELQRTGSHRQKARNKKTKSRPKTNQAELQATQTKMLIEGNGMEMSNENLSGGENSTSSKHESGISIIEQEFFIIQIFLLLIAICSGSVLSSMSTTSQTSDSLQSKESFANGFVEIENWFSSFKDEKVSSTSNDNPKLNAEIHQAITTEPSEYALSLCNHLFILYRDTQQRPFVLQFLPSFVTAYYNVLYHHPETADATIKDVCSTIDTFLLGLYNLGVLDDGQNEKIHEFRIPNLTLPSIYHTPNPDHYAPTPLTQHAISKHEKKCEVVRLQSFTPFDSVNATTREQILWFLLIQYGAYVSTMDAYSRQAYLKMSKKLVSQGFAFDEKTSSEETKSVLPPTGRRIHVSSRILTEILGTLCYFKANSKDKESSACMRLIKKRAEYEMYADVILMTESMGSLHEFETQRPEQQDTIGIEVEIAPTIDMVKQKRTATTARSMKNRQRSHKHHHHHPQQNESAIVENDLPNDTIEHLTFVPAPSDAKPTSLTPPTNHQNKSILDVLDENTPTTEFIRSTSTQASLSAEQQTDINTSDDQSDVTTPMIDQARTNISSSIGPATSSPSPSSARHYKPISLSSTQTYFKTIQQQRASSPNIQSVQTIVHQDEDSSLPRTSSMKHGEKRESAATVRFVGTNENGKKLEETYL